MEHLAAIEWYDGDFHLYVYRDTTDKDLLSCTLLIDEVAKEIGFKSKNELLCALMSREELAIMKSYGSYKSYLCVTDSECPTYTEVIKALTKQVSYE